MVRSKIKVIELIVTFYFYVGNTVSSDVFLQISCHYLFIKPINLFKKSFYCKLYGSIRSMFKNYLDLHTVIEKSYTSKLLKFKWNTINIIVIISVGSVNKYALVLLSVLEFPIPISFILLINSNFMLN